MRGLVKSAQLAFARTLRSAAGLVHESGMRRAKAVVCRTWLAGLRCGDAPCGRRNRRPRGAGEQWGRKRSLACEDRRLEGVPARRISVAEVVERGRGPDKRDLPLATGRVDGDPTHLLSQEGRRAQRRREPGPWWPSRGAGKARAGRSKERRGARVPDRWKAPRAAPPARSFTRADWKRPRRPQERA